MSRFVRGVLALALAATAATTLWAGGALACPAACRPLPLDVEMLGFAAQWRAPALQSQVYLRVHYPSDIAFGMLAAVSWVVALRVLVAKEHAP